MASPPSRRHKPPATANSPLISRSPQTTLTSAPTNLSAQSAIDDPNNLNSPSVASSIHIKSPPSTVNPQSPAQPPSGRKRKTSPMEASASVHDALPSQGTFGDPGGPSQVSESPAEGSSAPPPTKKTRTNTPWTPAEEKRLKELRDAGTSWSEIAKTFPNRTEGSVKKHWYKDMHYAEFAEDESAALLDAIKEYDAQKWKIIGQKVGKPAKACEQYARDNFAGRI